MIHSHPRSYKYEYDRTVLCHKKLYIQFGVHTVPTWKHVVSSTVRSTFQDWRDTLKSERRFFLLFEQLIKIPALSFASVYGQYRGACLAKLSRTHLSKIANPEKLRVILTTHQFLPDYSSGTEILTLETAKELKRLGHKVSVITGFPSREAVKDNERLDRYTHDGIDVLRFQHHFSPNSLQSNPIEMEYNNRLFGYYLKNYLKIEKPDIVHFFHLMKLSASAVDTCHDLGIPTVYTPTDFWFICPTCQLRLPDNRTCYGPEASAANCVRHIVTISQPDRVDHLVKRLPDWILAVLIYLFKHGLKIDKYYSPIIHAFAHRHDFLVERINKIDKVMTPTRIMHSLLTRNGLDENRTISIPFGLNLQYLIHAKRPEQAGILRLGYIGTLSEHKGVHILIDAMQKLSGEPVELKIYGKLDDFPEYVEKLQNRSRDDHRIQFCGTFPNHEIGKIFSSLDVLVVPSLWFENSPLVVYSAQAARCPVIASNMDGMSDIIEHGKNGLLFDAGNSTQLAESINQLINNKNLLNELSERSKVPLSIQDYASKLEWIYREILMSKVAE